MKIPEFISLILDRFGFNPTADQMNALECFGRFLASRNDMPMMLMRGSAGTGKTSLVSAMVQTLVSLRQKVVLMAPTGRAAKVLSISSSLPATTIHRKIYRQKALLGDFNLTGISPLNMRVQILAKEAGHAVHCKVAQMLKSKLVKIAEKQ